MLDGDTMADRDARRHRSSALLVRLAIFTALLAFFVIPGAAQTIHPKCQSISIPALRLECYDSLSKPTYTRMSIIDLSRDRASLAKVQAKVEVTDKLKSSSAAKVMSWEARLSMAAESPSTSKTCLESSKKPSLIAAISAAMRSCKGDL